MAASQGRNLAVTVLCAPCSKYGCDCLACYIRNMASTVLYVAYSLSTAVCEVRPASDGLPVPGYPVWSTGGSERCGWPQAMAEKWPRLSYVRHIQNPAVTVLCVLYIKYGLGCLICGIFALGSDPRCARHERRLARPRVSGLIRMRISRVQLAASQGRNLAWTVLYAPY